MKRSIMILSVILISLVFVATNAIAENVSFGDTHKYWTGWGNGTTYDDSRDVIGVPNFTGGNATIAGGALTSLTFNRTAGSTGYWGVLSPGDLFIDTNADNYWDYVVDLSAWGTAGKSNPDPSAVDGYYDIYSLHLALNSTTGYILSGTDNTGDWKGYYIRDRHPVAAVVDGMNGSGSAYFSGWGNGTTTQYTFNFDGLDLGDGSGNFIIGWQPNCANDVVYENVHYTPEPATMALLGLGFAGLLRLRKKRAVSRE